MTSLEEFDSPLCFRVDNPEQLDLDEPDTRLDQAQRARIRSLSTEGRQYMQKEALVTDSVSGDTWRFACDEGEYAQATDLAPPPIGFMATGMVSSFMDEILALADQREIAITDIELVLDTYYERTSGSLLQGTAAGKARTPDLKAIVDTDADETTLTDLVETAVSMSPVWNLMNEEHTNQFKLAVDDQELSTDSVAELDAPLADDPADAFRDLTHREENQEPPLIRHTSRTTEEFPDADERYASKVGEDVTSDSGSGHGQHLIHVRGTCTLLENGVKKIEQRTYSPRGTVFEFHSDEPEGHGGEGRAPPAMSYIAAGIGFCLMTHIGAYAKKLDKDLSGYRTVEDLHCSFGGASTGTGERGQAAPVETHVFMDTSEDKDVAREILDMAEQGCYLHALCRTETDLETEVEAREI